MKVLVISAGPRKGGNSDVLCDQFLRGSAESVNMVSKIRLAEKKISPCAACYHCLDAGVCAKQDDMSEIQQAMVDADVLVLSTPVYFYCMDAQMKMMIDRCFARYREMSRKKVYFIVTAADSDHNAADKTVAGLRGFLKCITEAVECGILYGTGTWDKGDVYKHPSLEQAYNIGKKV